MDFPKKLKTFEVCVSAQTVTFYHVQTKFTYICCIGDIPSQLLEFINVIEQLHQ